MNQLLLYLPNLKRELGEETYRTQIGILTERLAGEDTAVSEIELVQSGQDGYNMEESILSIGRHDRERHAVLLTDDGGLAAFCSAGRIPYCILLDEGGRKAELPDGAFCIETLEDVEYTYFERIYRRAMGLPWIILETQRLVIREITPEDVPRLYELYEDESITRYMEPLFQEQEQEIAYTREYIRNIYGFYGYGMWLITLKDSGEVIGRAGLEYKEGFEGLELGFMLGKEYQHQGYAYEACKAILEYGCSQLEQHSYRAVVHKDNTASQHLCERLGFQLSRRHGQKISANLEDKYLEYCINMPL